MKRSVSSDDLDPGAEETDAPGSLSCPRTPAGWIVTLIATLVFVVNIVSPPHLMDDVDAVQAQIARNMLVTGDWVTAHLDGIPYLEKSPLIYWMMAVSFRIFGIHDWAARMPLALAAVLLCWLTYRFARWGFDDTAGYYAGLVLATSTGLFLFTRILIPDVMLTLCVTAAVWGCFRLLEDEEDNRVAWSLVLGASLGSGLLLKGLVGVIFPLTATLTYMGLTRQLFSVVAWRRLNLDKITAVVLLIAVPWHVLATLRNPPYFSLSMHSGPGEYHGFFWFYFINEQLLRFLNLRYPRDYNTVPRSLFWLLNLVWLFPWSAYLPATLSLSYRASTRAGRLRLMCLCWAGIVMLFFTFSTTQEYYSMPIYPSLALLIGSAVSSGGRFVSVGRRTILASFALFCLALLIIFVRVARVPAQGDISTALTQNPALYTLSLGHMSDLTVGAFAYLKAPLALAILAFGAGSLCLLILPINETRQMALVVATAMIIFFQAAKLALVRFDGYLGSYPMVQALERSPRGMLVEANSYYAFSSVFFYTGQDALLLNGRNNNLEYGSYAPGAPKVFIDDATFASLWTESKTVYLLAYGTELPHLEKVVGKQNLHIVKQSSGNYLLTNHAAP